MESLTLGLVLTVAVTLAIAVFILVFERRRARDVVEDPQRLPPPEGRDGPDGT